MSKDKAPKVRKNFVIRFDGEVLFRGKSLVGARRVLKRFQRTNKRFAKVAVEIEEAVVTTSFKSKFFALPKSPPYSITNNWTAKVALDESDEDYDEDEDEDD